MTMTLRERNEPGRGVASANQPGESSRKRERRRERGETLSPARPVSVALLSATHFLDTADAKRDRQLLSRKPMQIAQASPFFRFFHRQGWFDAMFPRDRQRVASVQLEIGDGLLHLSVVGLEESRE